MKKTSTKKKQGRKANAAAKAAGEAILADLTEFADALDSGIELATKYTIRRVEIPEPPAEYGAQAVRDAQ